MSRVRLLVVQGPCVISKSCLNLRIDDIEWVLSMGDAYAIRLTHETIAGEMVNFASSLRARSDLLSLQQSVEQLACIPQM